MLTWCSWCGCVPTRLSHHRCVQSSLCASDVSLFNECVFDLEPVVAVFDLHSELIPSHTCSSCFISPVFTCNEPFQRCCRGANTESLETFMEWACVHQPLCAHTYTWSLWVNASSLVLDPLLWPPNPAPFLPSPCPSAELSAFIFNFFTFLLLVHV